MDTFDRKPPGGLIGRRLRQWYLDVIGYVPVNYKDKPAVVYSVKDSYYPYNVSF